MLSTSLSLLSLCYATLQHVPSPIASGLLSLLLLLGLATAASNQESSVFEVFTASDKMGLP